MKKTFIIIVIGFLLLVLSSFAYVSIGTNRINNQMREKLEANGYLDDDILKIKVTHSFLSVLLSYNEWNIMVEYVDEPEVLYSYTIKDGEIVFGGVSGNITDKNKLKHVDDFGKSL